MMPSFSHQDLRLLNPAFDSPLVDVMTELEYLRRLKLEGSTPPAIFFQLKEVFHMLESLSSARIEGNHTTLADYVESRVEGDADRPDQLAEIDNIDRAMEYLEGAIQADQPITEHLIRELHSIAVNNLVREGDATPGAYRTRSVTIAQSDHAPPNATTVPGYMSELVDFINRDDAPKYHLMKVAIAHHRFGWIHPFSNGNGRVVRLLTYAMLIKYGFNMNVDGAASSRIMNPTAVFCNDREKYYAMLGVADRGDDRDLEQWCGYVLNGILAEMRKIDRLTDYGYLQRQILLPAIAFARRRESISATEERILIALVNAPQATIKAGDLARTLPGLNANQRTYQIRKLLEDRLIQPVAANARQYTLVFANSKLLRGVIPSLAQEGFIPALLTRPI